MWLEAPSLSVWAWWQCKVLRLPDLGFGIVYTKDPNKLGFNQTALYGDGKKKIWRHCKSPVIHTILNIRPESFLSAALLCSLKPSLPNNFVSFYFFTKFQFCNFFLFYHCTKWDPDFFARLCQKVQTIFMYIFLFLENQTWHCKKCFL